MYMLLCILKRVFSFACEAVCVSTSHKETETTLTCIGAVNEGVLIST